MVSFILSLIVALVLGFLAGALYFAFLWRSVQFLASGSNLALYALKSGIRLVVVVTTVVVLLKSGIELYALLAAMLGFFLARLTAMFYIQPTIRTDMKVTRVESQGRGD